MPASFVAAASLGAAPANPGRTIDAPAMDSVAAPKKLRRLTKPEGFFMVMALVYHIPAKPKATCKETVGRARAPVRWCQMTQRSSASVATDTYPLERSTLVEAFQLYEMSLFG